MPQGPRGGWVRAAFAGLGAVLCAGTIGCLGTDKPAPPKYGTNTPQNGKQVSPGLPGTPTLPGSSTVGAKTGQPGYNSPYAGAGQGSGVMQTGGFATGTGNAYPQQNPQNRYSSTGGVNPAAGYGQGYPPPGTGGSHPTNSLVPPVGPMSPANYGPPAGAGGYPQSGANWGSTNTPATHSGNFAGNPPMTNLGDPGPVPPPPPSGNIASAADVAMPQAPIAPPTDNKQVVNLGIGVFGSQ